MIAKQWFCKPPRLMQHRHYQSYRCASVVIPFLVLNMFYSFWFIT
uniref:Uncharacterized protein n=1 Tax=Rhizophora mucronata TaxID=61149 RepID=A0A2P2PGG2_RHIMU